MARAYGANASLLAAFESTYGSTPVDGYWQLPFVSTSLGSEQGLIANDLIGLGRDPSAPIRDVIKVEGDMVVPLDVRHIGLWLKALLGEPTSVGTGVVTHTFTSGTPSLPSLTLETGLPDIPAWFEAILLKAVAREPKARFETAEEFLLALERGANRPLAVRRKSPLLERDPQLGLKLLAAGSLVLNILLLYLLLVR